MNKYNDIEIQTAKNLLKEGYKWIARGYYGVIFAYESKPIEDYEPKMVCHYYVPIFESIKRNDKEPVSLESIVHPQILDDAERRYLRAVIRPFMDRVEYIRKYKGTLNYGFKYECIDGRVRSEVNEDLIFGFELPAFKEGTMYKGMEPGKKYSLEELGL